MAIITTSQKCICGCNLLKDTDCLSDYYPTHIGVVHQSFCPNDGKMWPLVRERDPDYISNNNKKRFLNQIARTYNYRFRDLMSSIFYKYKDVDDRNRFIRLSAKETGLSLEKILPFAM